MSGLWKSGQFKPGWYYLLACWILGLSQPCGQAQITLNVKDFGAKGDAVQFYVNTVSNSVVVTTTNQFSTTDIGKTIEIFEVGKPTFGKNSYGIITNDWQDLIGVVTNIVNNTNIYLHVASQSGATYLPQRTASDIWATMGTDNTPSVSKAIDAASKYANAIIYIPNGKYLMMPTWRDGAGYRLGSICVHRGGLHFLGESQNDTILLSRGAWQSYTNFDSSATYPRRGFLFEIVAPIANDYPLVFENMTWDGGVQRGDLPVHGISCNRVDGLGWDEQHSAYLTCDSGNNTGTASLQVLTNVTVIHWRGESIKSIDQNTNGTLDIEHCLFGDICATALNVYPRWNIRNNVFSNCWQITEYYQKFYRGTAYFCNNFITNDPAFGPSGYFGNGISINGGIASASPLVVQSNLIYYGTSGRDIFITTPAANVSFLDNVIHCGSYNTIFAIGTQGSQGTDFNTNILIAGNSVYTDGDKLAAFVQFGGSGLGYVDGLVITNNFIYAPVQVQNALLNYSGAYTNVTFENNVFDSPQTGFTLGGTQCPLVEVCSNNAYSPVPIYYTSVGTNSLSLQKNGPVKVIGSGSVGQVVYLDDSIPQIIPRNAWMELDNCQNLSIKWNSAALTVYPSEKMTPGTAISLPYGSVLKFYWNGNAWTTNAPGTASSDKPVPPTALRVLN